MSSLPNLTDAQNTVRGFAHQAKEAVMETLGLDFDESDGDHLLEVMKSFDTAMLLTNLHAVPTGRPMSIAKMDSEGVWFVTDDQSPKAMEVAADQNALITLQSRTAYAVVRGDAELVHDMDKLKEVWSPTMKLWWPKGPQEKGMVLLKFTPRSGQYWDLRGARGLRFIKHVAEAAITGTDVEPTPGVEGEAVVP